MDLPPDPLEELENSMKPPIMPEMDIYADPPCRALDDLEHTIENHQRPGLPMFDQLDEMLDNLEREIELQDELPLISEQVLPKQEFNGEHIPQGAGGPKSTTPPIPDLGEMPTSKQYSMPVSRMKGRSGNRGRNTHDGEDGCYCYLYETWVTDGCDESCQDFEQDEYTPEDEEKRCKHSVFQAGEESDD